MVIIINKNGSIAQITPTTVYQGSSLANELTVFAPFSVSSYASIIATFKLPSGEYIEPLVAFATAEQPQGFGAWSVLLPASVTAISGTVKFSLSFIGSGAVRMVTGEAEFTVNASVPSVLPETPSSNIYEAILAALASILERHPDWDESSQTSQSYIANKPPIVQLFNALGALIGAKVNGDLDVTGGLTVNELSIFSELVTALNGVLVSGGLIVDGVDFEQKITLSDDLNVVYANVGSVKGTTIPFNYSVGSGTIPRRTLDGVINAGDPTTSDDSYQLVNTRFFNTNAATKLTYDSTLGVLSLTKRDGTVIGSVNLPLSSIVANVEYNDSNESLVISFANGQTVTIPLQTLVLPAWVTDLDNIPSGSGNVPPTADAVKSYVDSSAADAIRAEVTAPAVVIPDDVSSINPVVSITTTPATAYLNVYGKNLLDATTVIPYYQGTATGNADGSVVWSAGSQYLRFNRYIPKGSVVSYSFTWSAVDSETIGRVRFYGSTISDATLVYDSNTTGPTRSGTFVASADIYIFLIYKTSGATPIEAPITLTNLTLNIGSDKSFTPYVTPTTLSLNNGSTVAALTGYSTLIPPEGTDTTLSATYNRDSTKVINYLIKKIEEIQNAIAT